MLADALVRAVGRGRDNELFVLLADLLELDESSRSALAGGAAWRWAGIIKSCSSVPGRRVSNFPSRVYQRDSASRSLSDRRSGKRRADRQSRICGTK